MYDVYVTLTITITNFEKAPSASTKAASLDFRNPEQILPASEHILELNKENAVIFAMCSTDNLPSSYPNHIVEWLKAFPTDLGRVYFVFEGLLLDFRKEDNSNTLQDKLKQ